MPLPGGKPLRRRRGRLYLLLIVFVAIVVVIFVNMVIFVRNLPPVQADGWQELARPGFISSAHETAAGAVVAVTEPAVLSGNFSRLLVYAYHEKSLCMSNLEFFVRYAGMEAMQSTLFVFVINGHVVSVPLPALNNVLVLPRANTGLDFGAYSYALEEVERRLAGQNSALRHFGFMNCGVTGPFLPAYLRGFDWFAAFAERLTDRVRLVGTYLTCLDATDLGGHGPRIEGHCWFTDTEGIATLRAESVLRPMNSKVDAIVNGEYGLTRAMFKHGFTIDTLLYKYQNVDWTDERNWDCNANRFVGRNGAYDGGTINPFEVIFFKRLWPTLADPEQRSVRYVETSRLIAWRSLWSSGGGGASSDTPLPLVPPAPYFPDFEEANYSNRGNFLSLGWSLLSSLFSRKTIKACSPRRSSSSLLTSVVQGKTIVVLTHELTLTGAPFVCAELAQTLAEAGASVTLLVGPHGGIATMEVLMERVRAMVPTPLFAVDFFTSDDGSVSLSVGRAGSANLVIVSTIIPEHGLWLQKFRAFFPLHRGLVWWIHEGAAVVATLKYGARSAALDTMLVPGLLNGLVFPSASTEKWWVSLLISERGYRSPVCVQRAIPWGLPPWRLRDIDSAAADTDAKSALRLSKGLAPNDFVFLTLSTFQPIKGYAGIFKAFAKARLLCGGNVGGEQQLPRLRLLAVGTQYGYFPQGEEWARTDADIIIETPTTVVAQLLAIADAYVSNTQGGGETWGLSTLAALAAGKPVLASRAGATLEQMRPDVTALVHDVPDVATDLGDFEYVQLAQHMCSIVRDRPLAANLALNAKAYARETFGAAHIDKALTDLIVNLV